MKLVAALIVKDELGRYLEACVGHLLEFCDEVRVLDDGSTDGGLQWLLGRRGVAVASNDGPAFFEHEGRARNRLLAWTLAGGPTHVLSIDADEFVADGAQLRRAAGEGWDVWELCMEEVWEATGDLLRVREDGGWRPHPVAALWRPGLLQGAGGGVADLALACGREPVAVRAHPRTGCVETELLHFGWADAAARPARMQRYVVHDGGRYHAGAHIDSIGWRDGRVQLRGRPWPDGLPRQAILARAGGHARGVDA